MQTYAIEAHVPDDKIVTWFTGTVSDAKRETRRTFKDENISKIVLWSSVKADARAIFTLSR